MEYFLEDFYFERIGVVEINKSRSIYFMMLFHEFTDYSLQNIYGLNTTTIVNS